MGLTLNLTENYRYSSCKYHMRCEHKWAKDEPVEHSVYYLVERTGYLICRAQCKMKCGELRSKLVR